LDGVVACSNVVSSDYLTLLVHLGVVSVRQDRNGTVFKSTGPF
jgi:hypothetical protein